MADGKTAYENWKVNGFWPDEESRTAGLQYMAGAMQGEGGNIALLNPYASQWNGQTDQYEQGSNVVDYGKSTGPEVVTAYRAPGGYSNGIVPGGYDPANPSSAAQPLAVGTKLGTYNYSSSEPDADGWSQSQQTYTAPNGTNPLIDPSIRAAQSATNAPPAPPAPPAQQSSGIVGSSLSLGGEDAGNPANSYMTTSGQTAQYQGPGGFSVGGVGHSVADITPGPNGGSIKWAVHNTTGVTYETLTRDEFIQKYGQDLADKFYGRTGYESDGQFESSITGYTPDGKGFTANGMTFTAADRLPDGSIRWVRSDGQEFGSINKQEFALWFGVEAANRFYDGQTNRPPVEDRPNMGVPGITINPLVKGYVKPGQAGQGPFGKDVPEFDPWKWMVQPPLPPTFNRDGNSGYLPEGAGPDSAPFVGLVLGNMTDGDWKRIYDTAFRLKYTPEQLVNAMKPFGINLTVKAINDFISGNGLPPLGTI